MSKTMKNMQIILQKNKMNKVKRQSKNIQASILNI